MTEARKVPRLDRATMTTIRRHAHKTAAEFYAPTLARLVDVAQVARSRHEDVNQAIEVECEQILAAAARRQQADNRPPHD